jgi:transposase InsO family protein
VRYFESGKLQQNAFIESFNGRAPGPVHSSNQDGAHITRTGALSWRHGKKDYNTVRQHSALANFTD